MAYTALHKVATEDDTLAELTDEDGDLIVVWFYLLAAAPPWGRFPADPRKLKARVCPLVDRLSCADVGRLAARLAERGLLTEYVCRWTDEHCLAITHYSRYNSAGRQWHRMGQPEFSPPPGWEPNSKLLSYLQSVAAGSYKSKRLDDECAKFGVGVGQVARNTPKEHSQGTTPRDQSRQLKVVSVIHELPRDHSLGTTPEGQNMQVPRDHSLGTTPIGSGQHGDGDGDGDTTNDVSVSAGRARLDARPPETENGGGNGNDPSPTPEEIWLAMHGPPPKRQDEQVNYVLARSAWIRGLTGPEYGYQFPPALNS
jgi:hypothetical protein